MLEKDVGPGRRRSYVLTAQQTNLVRSVLRNEPHYLNHSHYRDPETGAKTVLPLGPEEISRFVSAWERGPVGCIGSMNRAIASVREPTRSARYLLAAFDLEILMDRSRPMGESRDLVGIPTYLEDGYTDLGIFPARGRREKIQVDKERLSHHLVSCKRRAVKDPPLEGDGDHELAGRLRALATSLRESVEYREVEVGPRESRDTVLLSDCVERKTMACRHLAILMQLLLQEYGISSRLVKGVVRLFGLKGRHAWNVVDYGDRCALVDVTFAGDDGPLVLVGASSMDVYARAADANRVYSPSPATAHHYEIRRSRIPSRVG